MVLPGSRVRLVPELGLESELGLGPEVWFEPEVFLGFEFLLGPKRTSLAPDELIVGVEWEPVEGPGSFAKVGRRNAMVVAIASACLQVDEERHAARLALGSVGPTVLRASRAEELAEQGDWSDPATLAEFGRLAAAESRPIDDLRGTAEYRRHVVAVLARRALTQAGAWAETERS